MKKAIMFTGVVFGLSLVASLYSAPRMYIGVTKTSINEGDKRTGVYVSISSTGWTQVLGSDVRRRHALLQTLTPQNGLVCLSSASTSGTVCSATTLGVRLSTSAEYNDYNESLLYGRMEDAKGGSVLIYGMEYYDSADSSSFQ